MTHQSWLPLATWQPKMSWCIVQRGKDPNCIWETEQRIWTVFPQSIVQQGLFSLDRNMFVLFICVYLLGNLIFF